MGLVLESDIIEAVYLTVFLFWIVFVYFVKNYDYWAQRGVPHVRPVFPLGSNPQMVLANVHQALVVQQSYQQFMSHRFFGTIEVRTPCLIINDPDLVRDILSKDFSHFSDRSIAEMSSNEHLNHNLVTMKGEEWRDMRSKLTPAYTTCKMKMMSSLVNECSRKLRAAVSGKVSSSNIVNIDEVASRFTMDVIGSCVFGLDLNTLSDDNSQFYKVTKKMFRWDLYMIVKTYLVRCFPLLNKIPFFKMIDPEIRDYLTNLILRTVAYRKSNNIRRCDFLDLLIKIQQNESILDEDESVASKNEDFLSKKHFKSEGMSELQMSAESYVFLGAGFETSSSVVQFCLYELACNQAVQERLSSEVREVLGRHEPYGQLTCSILQEMTFLHQVVSETLRHYPPFSFLNRVCTKSYKIPDTDVVIEEGVRLIVPVYSIHHDPRYYPDPYTFDPDRFTPEEVHKRHKYVFLPFGEGPRLCIGYRFGMMLAKAALVTLVHDYVFSLAPDTPMPVMLNSRSVVLQPSQPLSLVLTRRAHLT